MHKTEEILRAKGCCRENIAKNIRCTVTQGNIKFIKCSKCLRG